MEKDYNCYCHSLLRIEEVPLFIVFVCHPSALSSIAGVHNFGNVGAVHKLL